ncbi:hypothetical protein DAI22_03g048250 [Oryza sativa Japonica Group]|nr:hypothetical protein DAI22_03g048250 [Oryza sativa Japonica Group]
MVRSKPFQLFSSVRKTMRLALAEGVDQDCSVKEQNVLNISTACLQIICLHENREVIG